jgi:hypothetical protein
MLAMLNAVEEGLGVLPRWSGGVLPSRLIESGIR